MISNELLTEFQKELVPIMDLQEKLLNIKESDISKIVEIINEEFTTKISLRRVLSVLSSLLYARPIYIYLYCQILQFISSKIKPLFDSHEISSLFENKSALLVFLQAKLITANSIIQKFDNRQFDINFFFPDIETAKKPKNIKTMQNDEYRFYGHNEDNIAKIIRNDDVHSLNKALKLDELLLNSTIHTSRYETFDFVKSFGKKPSLIEYSAFFGRVNVFRYLLERGAVVSEVLPEFAVCGGSIEIIHSLEENKHLTFGAECLQASVEFFQYELIEYIISTNNVKYSIFDLLESIKHFNYEVFIEIIKVGELCTVDNMNQCLFYSIEYQNIDALNLILKFDGIDVNARTDFEIIFFIFIIHL
ncbi:hypothetical protein M9Y10_034311 [Tritrichomonas musculus]|uniref:DUF3447 domain-containing protein n=1 Tax=Tritrichomonas musculus TaxID=1915356 RepID=A0ABR2KFA8_9EUKA